MTAENADFEQFVTRHREQLLRFAFLLCHDRGRAEDLTQDALWKAYRRWNGHPESLASPAAYVRRIVANDYLGWRRRLPSREIVGTEIVPPTSTPSAEAQVIRRETLWHSMSVLPARQRAVLVLRYYEDLDDAEIAAILGCASGTVRSLASRALATIRRSADAPLLSNLIAE